MAYATSRGEARRLASSCVKFIVTRVYKRSLECRYYSTAHPHTTASRDCYVAIVPLISSYRCIATRLAVTLPASR